MAFAEINQKELVKRTGLAQSTVSSALNRSNGSSDTPAYAKACGVDPYWLATGDGEMAQSPSPTYPLVTASNKPLARMDSAGAATKTIATLEQITEALAGYLAGMDEDARDDAGDILRKLAHKPENHARAAAMLGTAFQSGRKKSA